MKHKVLSDALDEISQAYIAEAAAPTKRPRPLWLGAVAAVAAIAFFLFSTAKPATVQAEGFLTSPVYPEMVNFSESNWGQWWESQKAQYNQPQGYADSAEAFFRSSIPAILNSEENSQVYSPVSVYMALSMLSETTGSHTQQQLLNLLGAASMETLRTQANHVWNAHYSDDGLSTSLLANSLWLDNTATYNQTTIDTLSRSYFASVYLGDLGSDETNTALRAWLDQQTHELLQEQTQAVKLEKNCLLALISSIYYNVQWSEPFYETNNYTAPFHTSTGDVDTTYLRKTLSYGPYYQGEDFGAVALSLQDDSRMWLILPQEGLTPADLLESGYALDMIFSGSTESTDIRVNLSMPKFDISSSLDLIPALQQLGVTDVFDTNADFSPLLDNDDSNPYVDRINHAARVAVDEKGVTATAYTLIEVDRAAAEIEKEMDFTLDRPFLFLIESRDGLPLFTGIINRP